MPCSQYYGESIQSFPLNIMLSQSFLRYSMQVKFSAIPIFLRMFTMQMYWILSDAFSILNDMIIWLFFLFIGKIDYVIMFPEIESLICIFFTYEWFSFKKSDNIVCNNSYSLHKSYLGHGILIFLHRTRFYLLIFY